MLHRETLMLTFKQYAQPILTEGISHLEDLSIDKFISTIDNLSKFIISEKLDGAQLSFGFDNNGKFYTRRKSSPVLIRKPSEYGINGAANGFKSAHAALLKVVNILRDVVGAGREVECEILFGNQPNAIEYDLDGFNYIAFLRSVQGQDADKTPDQEIVGKLDQALKGKSVAVKTMQVYTDDGVNVEEEEKMTQWKFTSTQVINNNILTKVNVQQEMFKLKRYLEEKNKPLSAVGINMTNRQVVTVSLNEVPVKDRPAIKVEREKVAAALFNDFKLPIKKKLLDAYAGKIQSKMNSSNGNVEGIVLLDPDSDDQTKIVDKGDFTKLNKFNHEVRRTISGQILTNDPAAPLTSRGGIVGNTKLRLYKIIGIPDVSNASSLKSTLKKFGAITRDGLVSAINDKLRNLELDSVKRKAKAIIQYSVEALDKALGEFKLHSKSYSVDLKGDKKAKYDDEIKYRTLLAFAEARKELNSLESKILDANRISDIYLALFPKQIDRLFTEPVMAESLTEDDGAAAASGAVTSADIATFPQPLFSRGTMIKRTRSSKAKTMIAKRRKKKRS